MTTTKMTHACQSATATVCISKQTHLYMTCTALCVSIKRSVKHIFNHANGMVYVSTSYFIV